MKKKTKEYQTFALKDIFPEYELKGYVNGIEKIVQKNSENKKPRFGKNTVWSKKDLWFHKYSTVKYLNNS